MAWRTLGKDSSLLVFDTGDTLRTELFRVRKLGHVEGTGQDYALVSAQPSLDRPDLRAFYTLPMKGGRMDKADLYPWHLPGRLLDGETGEPYYTAEVYSGEVLPDTVGVIWYETQVLPDGAIKQNTTLLRLNGQRTDTLVFFGQVRKSFTQGLAFKGACRRLPSTDVTATP